MKQRLKRLTPWKVHASNPTRSHVIIAGDSMVKHLDGYKMSKTDTRVNKYLLIQDAQRKNPLKLILHVGTNSLKGREKSTRCAQEIVSLAESIKSSAQNTELAISGLIMRTDEATLTRKVSEVNSELKGLCMQRN